MVAREKRKATAVLIDDHAGALKAACEIMKDEFEILATGMNGETALEIISISNPDIVVLDIGLPGVNGFETVRQLRAHGCATKIVFLSIMEDLDYVQAARAMGSSYVVKRRMRTDLLPAARDAMDGHTFLSPILSV